MPVEKARGDRGSTKYPGEKEKAIAFVKADPDAKGKKIKDILGLKASGNLINTWLRDHKRKPQSQQPQPKTEERNDPPKNNNALEQNLFCSFCGKSQFEVHKLIAGPAVYICDECIQLCSEIIDEASDDEFLEKHRAEDFIRNIRYIEKNSIIAFENTCAYIKGVVDCLDRFKSSKHRKR